MRSFQSACCPWCKGLAEGERQRAWGSPEVPGHNCSGSASPVLQDRVRTGAGNGGRSRPCWLVQLPAAGCVHRQIASSGRSFSACAISDRGLVCFQPLRLQKVLAGVFCSVFAA